MLPRRIALSAATLACLSSCACLFLFSCITDISSHVYNIQIIYANNKNLGKEFNIIQYFVSLGSDRANGSTSVVRACRAWRRRRSVPGLHFRRCCCGAAAAAAGVVLRVPRVPAAHRRPVAAIGPSSGPVCWRVACRNHFSLARLSFR